MSVQFAKVLIPAPVAMPRGALWASALFSGLARAGQSVWCGLEAFGQGRANAELVRLADSLEGQRPEVAQTLRDAMHRAATHRDSQH